MGVTTCHGRRWLRSPIGKGGWGQSTAKLGRMKLCGHTFWACKAPHAPKSRRCMMRVDSRASCYNHVQALKTNRANVLVNCLNSIVWNHTVMVCKTSMTYCIKKISHQLMRAVCLVSVGYHRLFLCALVQGVCVFHNKKGIITFGLSVSFHIFLQGRNDSAAASFRR